MPTALCKPQAVESERSLRPITLGAVALGGLEACWSAHRLLDPCVEDLVEQNAEDP